MSAAERLIHLRRLDTHERTTTPEREVEKLKLEQQLNKKINSE